MKSLGVSLIAVCLWACPNNDRRGDPQVTLELRGTPHLLAYQDGEGPWTVLEPSSGGTYELWVDDIYMVVAVCTRGSEFAAETYAATAADGDRVILEPCATPPVPPSDLVEASGTMLQAGRVYVGGQGNASNNAPWPFAFDVRPGVHWLIASNAYDLATDDGRVAIRRQQEVTTSTTLPDVDLVAEGVLLTPAAFTVGGLLTDDAVSTEVRARLAGSSVSAPVSASRSSTAFVLPASALEVGDQQVLQINALSNLATDASLRTISTAMIDQREVELLPPLLDVTMSSTSASWVSLPIADFDLLRFSVGNGFDSRSIRTTRSWIERCQCTTLSFDAVPPGYDAAWVIPSARRFSVGLVTEDRGVRRSSSLTRVVNP